MTTSAAANEAANVMFTDEQLQEARREHLFSYDTQCFPFHMHFRRMFQLEEAGTDGLSEIHKMSLREDRAPLSLALMHGFKVAGRKIPTKWNKALGRKKDRLKKFMASKAFREFHETYIAFVQQVIVPLIGDECGVVFQDPPTFRVQLPSASPIGKVHTDSDYDCHVDTEINIWVPVVDVWGTNTLYTESAPGLKDFHPLEASYGQAFRFWGNQCQHYTVANSTDSTRVSFDFRVKRDLLQCRKRPYYCRLDPRLLRLPGDATLALHQRLEGLHLTKPHTGLTKPHTGDTTLALHQRLQGLHLTKPHTGLTKPHTGDTTLALHQRLQGLHR